MMANSWENLSLQKAMNILLSLESAIKQAAAIQQGEAVSKIEQKTASRNHSAKVF